MQVYPPIPTLHFLKKPFACTMNLYEIHILVSEKYIRLMHLLPKPWTKALHAMDRHDRRWIKPWTTPCWTIIISSLGNKMIQHQTRSWTNHQFYDGCLQYLQCSQPFPVCWTIQPVKLETRWRLQGLSDPWWQPNGVQRRNAARFPVDVSR